MNWLNERRFTFDRIKILPISKFSLVTYSSEYSSRQFGRIEEKSHRILLLHSLRWMQCCRATRKMERQKEGGGEREREKRPHATFLSHKSLRFWIFRVKRDGDGGREGEESWWVIRGGVRARVQGLPFGIGALQRPPPINLLPSGAGLTNISEG